jgi:uncharacterized protein HemX
MARGSRMSRMSLKPVRLGRRRSAPGGSEDKASEKSLEKSSSEAPTKASPTTEGSKAADTKTVGGRSGEEAPALNMQERMEGLQGWMAEIERKQSRMTRVGGAAAILAVLAAGAALALGIINKQDAATKDDVDELREEVNSLSAAIEKQTEKQLGSLNQQVKGFETRIGSLEQQQQQNAATIASLQSRVNKQAAAVPAPAPAVPAPAAKP